MAREILADLAASAGPARADIRDDPVPRAATAARRPGPTRRLRPGQAPAAPADHLPRHSTAPRSSPPGKDLAALQRQLRPKVRATLSARATALTRTGVTTWDFGPLPKVFTDGEVKAYPALVDAGAAVDVRLFETADAAARAMRAGTRRLVLLAVKSPANEVAKRLTTAQKLVLSDNPHGSVAALFTDCVSCRRRRRSSPRQAAPPGTPKRSTGSSSTSGPGCTPPPTRSSPGRKRSSGAPTTHGCASPRSAAPPSSPAVADIRAQLDRLIAPGFLTTAGTTRLPGPRPLRQGRQPPPRQAHRERRPRRTADGRRPPGPGRLPDRPRRRSPPRPGRPTPPAEIRWQIEELRVSLFAQTMGTPTPVSERRIMTAIERLS